MSDEELTPEQHAARAAEIEKTNPVLAARYRVQHGIERKVAPPKDHDARNGVARYTALRGDPEPAQTSELRKKYLELRQLNPIVAARFARENDLYSK